MRSRLSYIGSASLDNLGSDDRLGSRLNGERLLLSSVALLPLWLEVNVAFTLGWTTIDGVCPLTSYYGC